VAASTIEEKAYWGGAILRTTRLLPHGVSLTLYIDACYSGAFTMDWYGWFSVFTQVLLKVIEANDKLAMTW
jgi:hypothetical protein